jgi:hypothetical protein
LSAIGFTLGFTRDDSSRRCGSWLVATVRERRGRERFIRSRGSRLWRSKNEGFVGSRSRGCRTRFLCLSRRRHFIRRKQRHRRHYRSFLLFAFLRRRFFLFACCLGGAVFLFFRVYAGYSGWTQSQLKERPSERRGCGLGCRSVSGFLLQDSPNRAAGLVVCFFRGIEDQRGCHLAQRVHDTLRRSQHATILRHRSIYRAVPLCALVQAGGSRARVIQGATAGSLG